MPLSSEAKMAEWTVPTLKEYIEARLRAFEALHDKDVQAFHTYTRVKDEALLLQAREYERRLDALNGEQARIAGTQATYISRELWERFIQEDANWKRRMELEQTALLPRQEFQAYKEATYKAITLKAGERSGVGATASVIYSVIAMIGTIIVAAGVILTIIARAHS